MRRNTERAILIWLAMVWVACLVLGGILHLVKFLVYVALVATLAIVALGMLRHGSSRR
jgi:hypothetical protein